MSDFEVQLVAVERDDGGLSILSIITRAPARSFAPAVAEACGFALSPDAQWWSRDMSDDAIEQEMARAGLSAVSWSCVTADDLPSDRRHRAAWELAQ